MILELGLELVYEFVVPFAWISWFIERISNYIDIDMVFISASVGVTEAKTEDSELLGIDEVFEGSDGEIKEFDEYSDYLAINDEIDKIRSKMGSVNDPGFIKDTELKDYPVINEYCEKLIDYGDDPEHPRILNNYDKIEIYK
jgi:hypothetical protein